MVNPWDSKYRVIDIPAPDPSVLAEFDKLPRDEFTGGRQRFRRFSQYRVDYDKSTDAWKLELLPHRPFLQPRMVNGFMGGVQRPFEPLRIDPSPQIAAGARALDLDRDRSWQLNVHQCRVISTPEVAGISVPEGPHRDGHDYGMLAVFARRNITGGTNQLMPTGGGDPFFEVTLQPNQALVYQDGAMWHNATDIVAKDEMGGHRDLWIVAFNDWETRKYGAEFERQALAGDGAASVPAGM
ncbi:2OG-Fe dioxygenase family protein [Nocardia sp. NBC_01499]|uniref:2OG-Fe dioxygenase family protein n=1 Tax=Nocardia sp. NBC_01499 TaxID=2903597 RepID=UPI00386861FB